MADDSTNSNPTNDNAGAPKVEPIQDKGNPVADKSQTDAVALAEKVGKLEAENATLRSYQEKVDPVIQTIWSDQDTLNKVTEVHNKRLGIAPKDEPKPDDKIATTPQPSVDLESRALHIKNIGTDFSKNHGLDKLDEKARAEIMKPVEDELHFILNPQMDRSLQECLKTVSLPHLSGYLEKAWKLAYRDKDVKEAEERGKKIATDGSLGIIGSIPSSSLETSEVALTAKEKDIARKQGVSEEKYLENKKEILKNKGELF